VLDYTGADAVMVGRAAMGRPWLFREIDHYLKTGEPHPPISISEARDHLLTHLDDHYGFYGEHVGVRTARKHIGWYMRNLPEGHKMIAQINTIDNTAEQAQAVAKWFNQILAEHDGQLNNQRAAA